ncbi:hypothetical protein LUZ60_006157 [Juncus effusus]|nr:hypothetical protein LUZ60_006157 [Juncus effusus]
MEEGDGRKGEQQDLLIPKTEKKTASSEPQPQEKSEGGGWGGWGFSIFSDLSKAAEEISRNAVAVAKTAVTEIQSDISTPTTGDDDDEDDKHKEEKKEEKDKTEKDELCKSALDKLEKASQDSFLGQGLKVIDSSVENLAAGTWNALGNAWKGSSYLVHQLENSASSLAGSIQQGGVPTKASTFAPSSLLETGKTFTTRGMEVLERVGKETMELLIEETGLEVEKNNSPKEANRADIDQEHFEEEDDEELTFDRCFYIYGGPDQLEELEALSSHYALLFNRRKAKLLSDDKSFYEGKLREIQQMFNLETQIEGNGGQDSSDKGKSVEIPESNADAEIRKLCNSSVTKAASMAAGFASSVGGLAANEIIQKSTERLESIHSEGVHRLSEMCCLALSQLLLLGKSVISSANKTTEAGPGEEELKIEWPEDMVLKAKIIRWKAQSMSGDVVKVSNSFVTGISDIVEAYIATLQSGFAEKRDDGVGEEKVVQEKASEISKHLQSDQSNALSKIQDALHHLAYVVLSTSMPTP